MRNSVIKIGKKERLSLKEKVGQLFMPAAFINDTEEEITQLENLIRAQSVGGLCFFHSRASAATNYEGKKEVVYNERSFTILKKRIQRYQKAAKYPLLIAIDAEWGLAMRIENTPQYPYAITLGAIQEKNLIFEIGRNIARDCRAAGIHWNLAPVVDLNNNPNNPVIGYRSFGEDKLQVTEKALAFIKGTQSEGVLTSIKHFPGHGDTATDSHLDLPLIDKSKEELLNNELYPFQKLIKEGMDSVMVGHLSVPSIARGNKISSSVSKDIIKGLLRTEMGFEGVVVSDALNMHAVSKKYEEKGELEWLAFDAGNDILCFAEHIEEGIATILRKASKAQIEEGFSRVWKLKEKTFATEANRRFELTNPTDLNERVARKSLTLHKGAEQDIFEFKESSFLGISNFRDSDNQFFKTIYENKKFEYLPISEDVLNMPENNVLMALFPPQVKPANHFGLSQEELLWINSLLRSKNVVLYLFGNPYVLNHIESTNAKAVVMAYQNFDIFQEVAAAHFLGHFKAKGILPVSIST
ncbi:glycoside hydrolase family 3 protein [Flavobacteriaceae bacterium TP-CH-4]|uniref:beta-N-acetylhexosaminidase n=1 Tax=Pelagihabitans pacificus TaxID=2696054 RepID=A0A967AXI2_9FLAO|nr:glycoside hydrolase family 3 protein [Pelagihabitans pacificus]NHF61130.1 glycoside hydrolase family 3 protein [Pelagihabitans pacificus]